MYYNNNNDNTDDNINNSDRGSVSGCFGQPLDEVLLCLRLDLVEYDAWVVEGLKG